jgi:multidrug efflux system membrane fusion protein
VVQDDYTVAMRQVKIGLSEGNDVSIDGGLQPGESVVVDGAEKLADGMKVAVRQAGSSLTGTTPGRGRQAGNAQIRTETAKRGQ